MAQKEKITMCKYCHIKPAAIQHPRSLKDFALSDKCLECAVEEGEFIADAAIAMYDNDSSNYKNKEGAKK